MQIQFKTLTLKKRFPLAISRGVYDRSENLFVGVTQDGVTGWGEMSPGKSEGAALILTPIGRMVQWSDQFNPGKTLQM